MSGALRVMSPALHGGFRPSDRETELLPESRNYTAKETPRYRSPSASITARSHQTACLALSLSLGCGRAASIISRVK